MPYPYPSTLNSASFLSIKLASRDNYSLWKAQMICLVSSQELAGFVDGTIRPPPPENEDYQMWERSDWLVKGWILGSLSEHVLATVVGLSTARDVWTKLLYTFGPDKSLENREAAAARHITAIKHYPYPSTVNVGNFVSIKLTRTNYRQWFMQVSSLIESQDLSYLLNDPAPLEEVSGPYAENSISGNGSQTLHEDYKLWRRSDLLLKGWILGSITEDVLNVVTSDLHTSRDVLMRLENIFLPEKENTREGEIQKLGTPIKAAEHGNPFKDYAYPSTINVANFISVKLTRTNYRQWRPQMFSLIESHDLLDDFIFNTPPSPPEKTPYNNVQTNAMREWMNQDYRLWRRTDILLKGWILGSISDDVLTILSYLNTSREVLMKLEELFIPDARERYQFQGLNIDIKGEEAATKQKDISWYLPLYKATLVGDWERAKSFLDRDKDAATAVISVNNMRVLHVAIGTGKAIDFLEKLVERLPEEAFSTKMLFGDTPLSVAAMVGNVEAAKILIRKQPSLLSIRNDAGLLPLEIAASFPDKKIFLYFQSVSSDEVYAGSAAARLLSFLINAGNFDVALDLVKRYPHATTIETEKDGPPPLDMIAEKKSTFRSGMHLNFIESFIYSCAPVEIGNYFDKEIGGDIDIENPANDQTSAQSRMYLLGGCQILHLKLWSMIEVLVPPIKKIRQAKLAHHQAVQLVKCLCHGIKLSNDMNSYERRIGDAVIKAATLGVFEVLEEIVDALPYAFWYCDVSRHGIPQLAVINRSEKVFNLLYQMNEFRMYTTYFIDNFGNSILHLAGQLAPQHKLNLVSGAALQMQRELQWFQEVEKFVYPGVKDMENCSGETPQMIFTREHKELVREGEKWMKDTANSCSIAAALIITVVFAAAITVPGGNQENTGFPIFSDSHRTPFWLFAVSDTISLFTATTSLLLFLSILTARYAEQDFLHTLPKRLIFGLLTLFISITSMIIAFSTAVYLVFGESKGWVIIPLAALSCLPISSFVMLQFPLFKDLFLSTYTSGIFGKQSDHPFY